MTLGVVTTLAACDGTPVTAPQVMGDPSFALADGAHSGGNPDFFFLPPMVGDPAGHPYFDPDGFDGTQVPRVEICVVDTTDCAAAQPAGFPIVFDMTGSGSSTVRVDEDGEHYVVDWHTHDYALDPAVTYRIQVRVDTQLLGFADVDVVTSGSQLKNVNTGEYIALKDGRTLPIKFRIEDGAIAPPLVEISVDGSGRTFGPLPAIPYALADNATGADVYPLGGDGGFYLFGLFDTGTTRVRLFDEIPYFFTAFPDPNGGLVAHLPNALTDGNFFDSDASLLGVAAETTVRVRLNGLSAIDATTLTAPIGTDAQLEVADIPVVPQPSLDVTLIGGEINQSVVAAIDYTTEVTRSGYDFYPGLTDRTPTGTGIAGFSPIDAVPGPDITFYAPGDIAIPVLPLDLELVRIGVPAVRYGLVDVEFQDGGNSFLQTDPSLTPPINILFDTGTTITIVGDVVANALSLGAGAGSFDCLGGTSNGYEIDAVVLRSAAGSYTVSDIAICWREEVLPTPFLTAVTGSNLFDQVPTVFDGANDRLWIGEPTATPVAWSQQGPS